LTVSLVIGVGCGVFLSQAGGPQANAKPAIEMAALPWKALNMRMQRVGARAAGAAAAALRSPSSSGRVVPAEFFKSAMATAMKDGAMVGCQGRLVCARAVGLFFGTQSGKTEDVATAIAGEAGLEAQSIDDVSAEDLAGFDGLIVGAPTWNTGADEQRSGTTWDDYLETIRGMDLGGKPVAVFGSGDSIGYGDNFCDAIEELHSTFEAAGAKMLGYVDSSGYQHSESKSVKDGKFLGLATDQDNEDDQTAPRAKAWVAQIKSEGMPLM
jgi:flavodoxin I